MTDKKKLGDVSVLLLVVNSCVFLSHEQSGASVNPQIEVLGSARALGVPPSRILLQQP